jgi:hypothetical protein
VLPQRMGAQSSSSRPRAVAESATSRRSA